MIDFLAEYLGIPVEKVEQGVKEYYRNEIRKLWVECGYALKHAKYSLKKYFGTSELEELSINQLVLYLKHLRIIQKMLNEGGKENEGE
jgi:hypothetical protein